MPFLVPGVGFEPTRPLRTAEFKSATIHFADLGIWSETYAGLVFRTCVRSLRFALFVGVARTGCGLAGRASAECPMEEPLCP